MANTNRFVDFIGRLAQHVDGRVLGLFRLIFGLFMLYQCYYYYDAHLIDDGFMKPYLLFKYDGFGFVDRLPRTAMFGLLATLALSAVGIASGILFRLSCIVFALIQCYFLLLEKAYYNNHIYLFVLIAFLLSWTAADHFFSFKPQNKRLLSIPFWQQFMLQAQFVIVYFYASLIKLKADWFINRQPMTCLIQGYPETKPFSWLVKLPGMIDFVTYGGFLLDFSAPFLLWYKPIRKYALIPFIAFHFTNTQFFDDIGIFPYLMAASMIIFFQASDFRWFPGTPNVPESAKQSLTPRVKWALISYFSFQLLFPLRGYFLPNALDYSSIGNRFAWRVKADVREQIEMKFYAVHPETKEKKEVPVGGYLNPVQAKLLMQDPRAVVQFAEGIKTFFQTQGVENVGVQATIRMKYNGRPVSDFIDPNVNLANAEWSVWKPIVWLRQPGDL